MRHCVVVLPLMLILAVGSVPGEVFAQHGIMTMTRGRVTAVLDTYSGRFSARTSDGRSLLFAAEMGLTSHISVVIGDSIYTNYTKSQMKVPAPQVNLGRGIAEQGSDRLRYVWELKRGTGSVRIIQELEPVSDSSYQEVRVHLIVENATGATLQVGMTVMEDLDADGDDNVPLRDMMTVVDRERAFTEQNIPERLVMHSQAFLPDSAGCRILGPALTRPDIVTAGRWMYDSWLGTAVYGYRATDRPLLDVAVLLQWNSGLLRPGEKRHETTAVGLLVPPVPGPGPTTFAKEFVVPFIPSEAVLSIVTDSSTIVRVSMPYNDAWYEADKAQGGRWDTTVTVTPGHAVSVYLHPYMVGDHKKVKDSVSYYRMGFATVRAEKEVGAFIRHVGVRSFDGALVWPVTWWDSLYLNHGFMRHGQAIVHGNDSEMTVQLDATIVYGIYFYRQWYEWPTWGVPPGSSSLIALPPGGSLNYYASSGGVFDHWDRSYLPDGDLTVGGAGDVIVTDTPAWIPARIWASIIPGHNPSGTPSLAMSYLDHPSRRQLGTEYVFVPFRKKTARVQDDLLRIIAYEDDTELTLFDGTASVHLDRSEYLDTLISVPTVLRSNKPVAAYQHHLDWSYLGNDTMFFGGALTLLPPHLWGRRYYVVTNDAYQPNVAPLLDESWRRYPPVFKNLYLIIVTRKEHRQGIVVGDLPLDPASFTVFGDYAFTCVDIQPGYTVVYGAAPLLTVACGGGVGHPATPVYGPRFFNMSHIPPFNSKSGPPVIPHGESDNWEPRDAKE
ncbi:IgGFc-binding protein [bacterium]|nr:IgGFc-binding protein [bacterium]